MSTGEVQSVSTQSWHKWLRATCESRKAGSTAIETHELLEHYRVARHTWRRHGVLPSSTCCECCCNSTADRCLQATSAGSDTFVPYLQRWQEYRHFEE
eukprot:20079-Heterococcus_DN1.PRE.3